VSGPNLAKKRTSRKEWGKERRGRKKYSTSFPPQGNIAASMIATVKGSSKKSEDRTEGSLSRKKGKERVTPW